MSMYHQTHASVGPEVLYNQKVHTGTRTFAFCVKKPATGDPYLIIGQFLKLGEEWIRLKTVVPAPDAKSFYQGLCDALRALRSAECESPAEKPKEPAPPKREVARAASRA